MDKKFRLLYSRREIVIRPNALCYSGASTQFNAYRQRRTPENALLYKRNAINVTSLYRVIPIDHLRLPMTTTVGNSISYASAATAAAAFPLGAGVSFSFSLFLSLPFRLRFG